MVIFIVCYFNVCKDVEQVLLDWDWRCLHSDDLLVACHFAYLIPDLRRQRQEFPLCDGDLGIHCMCIDGRSHLGVVDRSSGPKWDVWFPWRCWLQLRSNVVGGRRGIRCVFSSGEWVYWGLVVVVDFFWYSWQRWRKSSSWYRQWNWSTGAGAGGGIGLLAGVGASVGGSGSQAFRALIRTPGPSSRACRVNSSFSRERMHSSEESCRTPTIGLGDTSSKSTLAVEVETGFCRYHSSRRSLKVFLATEPGMKRPPGNAIRPSSRSIHFPSWTYSLSTSQLLFQWSPPQK